MSGMVKSGGGGEMLMSYELMREMCVWSLCAFMLQLV